MSLVHTEMCHHFKIYTRFWRLKTKYRNHSYIDDILKWYNSGHPGLNINIYLQTFFLMYHLENVNVYMWLTSSLCQLLRPPWDNSSSECLYFLKQTLWKVVLCRMSDSSETMQIVFLLPVCSPLTVFKESCQVLVYECLFPCRTWTGVSIEILWKAGLRLSWWGVGRSRCYKNYLSLFMLFPPLPFFLCKMSLGFVHFVFYFVQVITALSRFSHLSTEEGPVVGGL